MSFNNKFLYGGISGIMARTITAPLDRIKILLQTNYATKNIKGMNKSASVFNHIIKNEGFLCLWKGNLVNCLRVFPYSSLQLGLFYNFKSKLNKYNCYNFYTILLSSMITQICVNTATHPIDLIRLRLQTEPDIKSIKDSVKSIYREGKLLNFYKGYIPALCSLIPFVSINFTLFDYLKTNWENQKLEHNNSQVYKTLVCSSFSSLIAQTFCFPLDTIRRRSELSGNNYSSIKDCYQKIRKHEGIKGFYRGFTITTMKLLPNNFIRFYIFHKLIEINTR